MSEALKMLLKNKVKRKTQASSPDKPTSPTQVVEGQPIVIDSEDIQKLSIKDEDFLALRGGSLEVATEKQPQLRPFAVKKPKPKEMIKERRTINLVVSRPAPPNAKLKPVDSAPCGPRYTKRGEIIPHSILGPVHNFVDEAVRRHEMRADFPAALSAPTVTHKLEVKKYERPKSTAFDHIPTSMNQENALLNWRRKMAERKRLQGHISNLLEKPLDRLVMNQDEKHREIEEKRKLIDRAIPVADYGKGYRVGSEFWKQSESFGDDLTGLKMTLTKTEKGSPVVFEHVGKPISVQYETCTTRQDDKATVDPKRSWLSSKYLKQRAKQLESVMTELDPHKPDFFHLEVIGNEQEAFVGRQSLEDYNNNNVNSEGYRQQDDPLSDYPDVITEPIIGPSLIFNGTEARWSGSSTENKGKVGAVARVIFESVAGERTISNLEVANNGTTAIFYEWRKITTPPAFDALKQDQTQRFYFNTGEGCNLPGDTTKLPFVFKSPNPGIFTETWELVTKPSLMGGASLQVVLRGIALQDDASFEEELMKIERGLQEKEADVMMRKIIDDIVRSIQKRDRPPSPIDAYVTEEEVFLRKNPGRFYDHETIRELKNIYVQLFAEEDREGREWNLCLDELQSCVSAVPDEEAQEELLNGLNKIIGKLSFQPLTPLQQLMYNAAHKFWEDTIDKIVGCSMLMRSMMGLPEVVMIETAAEPEMSGASAAAPTQPSKPEPKDDKKGKGKKGGGKDAKEDKGKKGKNAGKDAKDARPKSKDPKAKGGKGQPISPSKEPHVGDRGDSKTPNSQRATPTDTLAPSVRRKYTEKIYGQVYELLVEMVENMTIAFEDAKSRQTQ